MAPLLSALKHRQRRGATGRSAAGHATHEIVSPFPPQVRRARPGADLFDQGREAASGSGGVVDGLRRRDAPSGRSARPRRVTAPVPAETPTSCQPWDRRGNAPSCSDPGHARRELQSAVDQRRWVVPDPAWPTTWLRSPSRTRSLLAPPAACRTSCQARRRSWFPPGLGIDAVAHALAGRRHRVHWAQPGLTIPTIHRLLGDQFPTLQTAQVRGALAALGAVEKIGTSGEDTGVRFWSLPPSIKVGKCSHCGADTTMSRCGRGSSQAPSRRRSAPSARGRRRPRHR